MPIRIQRKRTKGWSAPEGAVYVGRPSKWKNPFVIGIDGDRAEVIRKFRDHISISLPEIRKELRGRDLMCWCPLSVECHADVLLEVANL